MREIYFKKHRKLCEQKKFSEGERKINVGVVLYNIFLYVLHIYLFSAKLAWMRSL